MQDQNDNNTIKDLTSINLETRDALMFKDWIDGMKYVDIAKKYGLTHQAVRKHSAKHEWKKLRREYTNRIYNEAVEGLKDVVAKMQMLISIDIDELFKQVSQSRRALTLEERAYLSSNLDKLLKQMRAHESEASPESGKSASVLIKKLTVELPPNTKPETVSALVPVGNVEFVNKDPNIVEHKTTLEDLDRVIDEEEQDKR